MPRPVRNSLRRKGGLRRKQKSTPLEGAPPWFRVISQRYGEETLLAFTRPGKPLFHRNPLGDLSSGNGGKVEATKTGETLGDPQLGST